MGTEKGSETEGTTGQESKRQTEGKIKREKERERGVVRARERGQHISMLEVDQREHVPEIELLAVNCWQALFSVQ